MTIVPFREYRYAIGNNAGRWNDQTVRAGYAIAVDGRFAHLTRHRWEDLLCVMDDFRRRMFVQDPQAAAQR